MIDRTTEFKVDKFNRELDERFGCALWNDFFKNKRISPEKIENLAMLKKNGKFGYVEKNWKFGYVEKNWKFGYVEKYWKFGYVEKNRKFGYVQIIENFEHVHLNWMYTCSAFRITYRECWNTSGLW